MTDRCGGVDRYSTGVAFSALPDLTLRTGSVDGVGTPLVAIPMCCTMVAAENYWKQWSGIAGMCVAP